MLPVLNRQDLFLPEAIDWVDREFGRMFRGLWGNGRVASGSAGVAAYPVDVREDDDHIYVDAELPGFRKDDIEVTIEKGVLHISAERSQEEAPGEKLLNERQYRRYYRAMTLPTAVDESKVEAKIENGVLSLTLPKSAEVKPRRIRIS